MMSETVTFRGHNGDQTEGYYAQPRRAGKVVAGVVAFFDKHLAAPAARSAA
jgi:hypothetical protein